MLSYSGPWKTETIFSAALEGDGVDSVDDDTVIADVIVLEEFGTASLGRFATASSKAFNLSAWFRPVTYNKPMLLVYNIERIEVYAHGRFAAPCDSVAVFAPLHLNR